jgi:hypothetical protein
MVSPPTSRTRRRRRSEPVEPKPTLSGLTPGDRLFGATFNPNTGFQAGTKPMSESSRQAQAGLNFFNPLASVTDRVLSGQNPRFSDFATDAGLFAAGLIPFVGPGLRAGGQAARAGAGLTVTGTGDAGKLSALVRRLNKSDDVADFITPETMQNAARSNDANQGLFRPGAQSFNYNDVPASATPYTFGLVPTEKLLPLRSVDRAAAPEGLGNVGPDNIQKLMDHLAQGGKWSDPVDVGYNVANKWGILDEGNHRLALALALGLDRVPATVTRNAGPLYNKRFLGMAEDGTEVNEIIGKNIGDLDTNQLRQDPLSDFADSVGPYYVPPTMHPLLLKYFQQ